MRVEGDTATIGITDHAQSELGDIVFVELPTPGRILQQGDSFGTVESVKTVSDLYSPISGEVTEVNPALGAQSELVNTDPYGQGWMLKLKLNDAAQLGALMSADAYSASLSD